MEAIVKISVFQFKNFKIMIKKIDIEKKLNIKYPKYFKGFGNFSKSALARLATFPSILFKWSIASLNGLFLSFNTIPPFTKF
jgi:hypothetical protein